MHIVDDLFEDDTHATRVWISESAHKGLTKFARKHSVDIAKLLEKVAYWAERGFASFEGGAGYPVKHERGGVFRIGYQSMMFRMLGFFVEHDDEFIIIDVFKKRGKSLGPDERRRINAVADVKKHRLWQRRIP